MSVLKLYDSPSAMTPMFPEWEEAKLRELAIQVIRKSSRLSGYFNPLTRQAIAELVGPMNSYYSNLIEGHSTHPLEIEKALKKEYSNDAKKKLLQQESRAHVIVNKELKVELLKHEEAGSWKFISWIHQRFYGELPEELKTITLKDGKKITITPGALRGIEVEVGKHIGPAAKYLKDFINFFTSTYSTKAINDPLKRIIGIAASHHRLAWIHPFPDGNGRVVRLFSDACFAKETIDAEGLWSISRGLSRNNKTYFQLLSNADQQRWNDYDGRGNLSDRYLSDFCKFFLETCIDQLDFMSDLLECDSLLKRVKTFGDLMVSRNELKKESIYILEEAILRGRLIRGDMPRITGKSENVARSLMNDLINLELLRSESKELRAPVHINFPLKFAPFFFPKLFPGDVEATMVP